MVIWICWHYVKKYINGVYMCIYLHIYNQNIHVFIYIYKCICKYHKAYAAIYQIASLTERILIRKTTGSDDINHYIVIYISSSIAHSSQDKQLDIYMYSFKFQNKRRNADNNITFITARLISVICVFKCSVSNGFDNKL